ncbi:MAG: hypothetical protein IT331_17340 [Anaerolineae bacterium]|nr:hypothetical protein [Anaerolineae bacterium]
MPIDFETILAPFRTAFMLQRRTINEMFEKVAKWLTKRLRETQERERATSSMQRFSFTGAAMEIWIDESQHGKLLSAESAPPEEFWAKMAAPFVNFWKNFTGSIKAMVKSEWVLPDVLATIAKFIETVLASIDRFKEPTPDLFDLKKGKQFWDIIGELFLFARLISTEATVKQVQRFSAGGIEMLGVARKHFPPKPPEAADEATGPSDSTKTLVGVALALPLVAQMLKQTARTASLMIRLQVLDKLSEVQKQAFDLRRDVLDLFYVDAMAMGRSLFGWVMEMGALTMWGLELGIRFLRAYGAEIETWITTLGTQLKTFADALMKFLRAMGDWLETFLSVDIGEHKTHGIMSLKIGDFDNPTKLKKVINVINLVLSDMVLTWLAGGEDKLKRTRAVLQALRKPTTPMTEVAPLDTSTLPGFPNIYDSFFGTGAVGLRTALTSTRDSLKTNMDTVLDTGATKFLEIGETFDKAGSAAARMGSAKRYEAVVTDAERLAKMAFGGDEMRQALQGKNDALTRAFENWLAASGFKMVAQALPIYIERMIDFWQAEAAKKPEERPTSPHILAKRAQVNRVKVPRIVLNVNEDRDLDKGLAAEVAALFQGAVGQAFRTALTQYAGE